MEETDLSTSLALLIGRHIFDGASPEKLAELHNVSLESVNKAWFQCRERLSKQFAAVEEREYKLLSDNDLQARLHQTLLLLLEWRENELRAEKLSSTMESVSEPAMDEENSSGD